NSLNPCFVEIRTGTLASVPAICPYASACTRWVCRISGRWRARYPASRTKARGSTSARSRMASSGTPRAVSSPAKSHAPASFSCRRRDGCEGNQPLGELLGILTGESECHGQPGEELVEDRVGGEDGPRAGRRLVDDLVRGPCLHVVHEHVCALEHLRHLRAQD